MRLVWVVIPLVLIGLIGISESFAESDASALDRLFPTDDHKDVKLTIETDKLQYFDGDLVSINWMAENLGTEPFPYYGSFLCRDAFQLSLESGSDEHRHGYLRGNWTMDLETLYPNAFGRNCMQEMIRTGILHPGETIKDSFIWNQLVYKGYKNDDARPEPGYYNLKIGLGGVRGCTEIQLVGDSPLPPKPEIPNDFEEIIIGNTKNISIKYHITGGELVSSNVYYEDDYTGRNIMYLLFNLEPTTEGMLILDIPDPLIQKNHVSKEATARYSIVVDGINVFEDIEKIDNCNSDTILIPFGPDTNQIGIQGQTFDSSRISDENILVPFSLPHCWWMGECQVPSESDEDVIQTNIIRVTKDGIKPKECDVSEHVLTFYETYEKTVLNNMCVYPKKIIVKTGDTVFWKSNFADEGGILHAGDVKWLEKSQWIWAGNPFNFTFTEPGIYYYSVRGSDIVQRDIGWIMVTDNQKAMDNAKDLSSITNTDESYRECPYLMKVIFKKT